MKSLWTGSIGFGLVNIPVKLFSATQESNLDFDMLDKKDHSNIKFMRVSEKTGKEVKWENIVKGYLLNEKYVVLTDEDFEKASPEKTKMIEISQFCNQEEIDTVYYENAYYLEPDKTGTKAYALLRDALAKTGKVALGTYVLRSKESIGMIKANGHALMLYKLRFKEEVRSHGELKIPTTKSTTAEVKVAIHLIEQLTKPFNIETFKDVYNEKLLKFIKAKAKGKAPVKTTMKVVHSASSNLMEQLKASLGQKKVKKAS
ncbi:MAG: Ku protein [Sediminibacterium sp.]